MFTNQNNNQVGGDVIAGDKTVNIYAPIGLNELQKLYEQLKANGIGDTSNGSFSEKLQHYLSARTDGDVRGLHEKLAASGRLDQLDLATALKEGATKSIMRHQMSRTAQRIYVIILDELHTGFELIVKPYVEASESRASIDKRTLELLQGISALLGENVLEFTIKDLHGLLYFLGGNCHIRWDKC